MPIKSPTGGDINYERRQSTKYNNTKKSDAVYANEPNEEFWEHEGETYKDEPARQCAAEDNTIKFCAICETSYDSFSFKCPECGSNEYFLLRCTECAEPGKEVCRKHGGLPTQTKEITDKMRRGNQVTGLCVSEIMLCPCKVHGNDCPYANQLVDEVRYGSPVPRCFPEQLYYDSIVEQFSDKYDLDDVADRVMLHRLAMTLVRISRAEKLVSKYGETVERTRISPDGTIERWDEQNAAFKSVDALDKRLQAWLKELQVSRASRNGSKFVVEEKKDLTTLLSTQVSEEDIIDVEFD